MKQQQLFGSRQVLAGMLNLTERRVTELIKTGILPRRTPSGFDLVGSVRGYIGCLKTEPNNLKSERLRHQKIKSDLLALALEEKTGKRVERDAVAKKLFELTRRTRDGLLNVPARLSGILAAETDQEVVFRLLTEEIQQCLLDLAS